MSSPAPVASHQDGCFLVLHSTPTTSSGTEPHPQASAFLRGSAHVQVLHGSVAIGAVFVRKGQGLCVETGQFDPALPIVAREGESSVEDGGGGEGGKVGEEVVDCVPLARRSWLLGVWDRFREKGGWTALVHITKGGWEGGWVGGKEKGVAGEFDWGFVLAFLDQSIQLVGLESGSNATSFHFRRSYLSSTPLPSLASPLRIFGVSIPMEWRKALQRVEDGGMVVMVVGSRNSGKSTLARLALQRAASSSFDDVVPILVDTDPGQPEASCPGTISFTHLTASTPATYNPKTLCACTLQKQHSHVIPVGATSPSQDPALFLAACSHLQHTLLHHLSSLASSSSSSSSAPNFVIVINTPGWVRGVGLEVQDALVRLFAPTVVWKLVGSSASSRFALECEKAGDMGRGGRRTVREVHDIESLASASGILLPPLPHPTPYIQHLPSATSDSIKSSFYSLLFDESFESMKDASSSAVLSPAPSPTAPSPTAPSPTAASPSVPFTPTSLPTYRTPSSTAVATPRSSPPTTRTPMIEEEEEEGGEEDAEEVEDGMEEEEEVGGEEDEEEEGEERVGVEGEGRLLDDAPPLPSALSALTALGDHPALRVSKRSGPEVRMARVAASIVQAPVGRVDLHVHSGCDSLAAAIWRKVPLWSVPLDGVTLIDFAASSPADSGMNAQLGSMQLAQQMLGRPVWLLTPQHSTPPPPLLDSPFATERPTSAQCVAQLKMASVGILERVEGGEEEIDGEGREGREGREEREEGRVESGGEGRLLFVRCVSSPEGVVALAAGRVPLPTAMFASLGTLPTPGIFPKSAVVEGKGTARIGGRG